MSGAGAPAASEVDARGLRLAVVATRWHEEITGALLDSAVRTARACGTEPAVVRVAGAVELPVAVTPMPDRVVWLPTNSPGSHVRRTLGADSGALVTLSKAGSA